MFGIITALNSMMDGQSTGAVCVGALNVFHTRCLFTQEGCRTQRQSVCEQFHRVFSLLEERQKVSRFLTQNTAGRFEFHNNNRCYLIDMKRLFNM